MTWKTTAAASIGTVNRSTGHFPKSLTRRTMAGEQAADTAQGGKKRTREETEDAKSEESADAATTASDDEPQRMNISTLLTAAARLEPTTKSSRGAVQAPDEARAASPATEKEPDLAGISTLLEIATTMVNASKSKEKESPSSSAQSEGSGDEALCDERPRKRTIPVGADRSQYPTDEELKDCKTRRFRDALFSWYDRFRDLTAYSKDHGDCQVPQKYPPNHALGVWVNKQRTERRLKEQGHRSSMTEHRIALLDKIGFHWAKYKGQAGWDSKYRELLEFHEANGHCNVPTKYRENSALGRWICAQRSQRKKWKRGEKTLMTQERYDKLVALDFDFDPMASKRLYEFDDYLQGSSEAQGVDKIAEAAPGVVGVEVPLEVGIPLPVQSLVVVSVYPTQKSPHLSTRKPQMRHRTEIR